MIINLIAVAIGGAFRSALRYLSSESLGYFFHAQIFFFNTFLINVVGSFLAGILYYFFIKYFNYFTPASKALLLSGFLGGFTTFSTFCLDFFHPFTAGNYNLAVFYVIISVIIGVVALFFGFYMIKAIFT
jgi:CrcB protein